MTQAARRSHTPIPHARRHFYGVLAKSVRPRPLTTVSAWSDKYRILTSKGSGEPGQWRTDRTPYLREILDHLSATSAVQRLVLMFAAQTGKTEVGLNWIGYVMQHAPAPMLVVLPTLEVRKRWVRQRLDPLLNETPVIRQIFDNRRARDAGNAEDLKDFPGGMLVVGGANSPASLASRLQAARCDVCKLSRRCRRASSVAPSMAPAPATPPTPGSPSVPTPANITAEIDTMR